MMQPYKSTRVRQNKSSILIYLVDDELLLLDLAELALQNGNYQIKKFQDPELAYQAFLKAKKKPELIISDYAMGRTNGVDFLTKCKKMVPAIKTILVSGTVGPEVVMVAPITIDRFLPKPYQPEILADLVKTVLA